MSPMSKKAKIFGVAVVATGVTVGSYVTIDQMFNKESASHVTKEIDPNKVNIKPKKSKENDTEKNEDLGFDLDVDGNEDEYSDIAERAAKKQEDYSDVFAYEEEVQNDDSNDLVKRAAKNKEDYSDVFAYEKESKDTSEFAFDNVEENKPTVNKDGQFAFNEDQKDNNTDVLVASLDLNTKDENEDTTLEDMVKHVENKDTEIESEIIVNKPQTPENPGTENPGTENPGTENPGTENPGTENPGTENPGTENPGTENPGTENPGTENPGTENPGTENPGTENPGTEDPGTENPGTENPGTEDPSTENPGTENPGTEDPGTENPGTENPGTENPGTENPGTEDPSTENPGTEN
ncbi:hypothetical protein ABFY79_26015, partial [Priestia aryabhattai]